MKIKQRKSKRIPCAHRYRVEKKQRERERKRKRDARRNPIKSRNPNKDLRVPNCAPFKERIMQEAVEVKARIDEEKRLRHMEAKARRQQEKFKEYETIDTDNCRVLVEKAGNTAHSFVQEVNKVIEKSDIIVQVLDARDPMGTRSAEVEKTVLGTGKRLLLLLNKCDLIPADNLKAWLIFLRKEFPTLPFKASTQNQRNQLSQNRGINIQELYEDEVISNKRCLGAQHLMKILGNYCRNKDIKISIKVGVVGFPNVGKSSVINSLKRTKACLTGATPGLTRLAQEVTLDKHVQLIDSPGVIFDKSDSTGAALRNACRVEALADPVTPALEIISRANKEQLMLQYKIKEDYVNGEEFMAHIAKARGFIGRGGIYNQDAAARLIINDWNSGKIKYYTVPPEENKNALISTQIVSTFAKEFELDSDFTDKSVMMNLPQVLPSSTVKMDVSSEEAMEAHAANEKDDEAEQNEKEDFDIEEMEDSSKEKRTRTLVRILANPSKKRKAQEVDDSINDPSYNNLRQNRSLKAAFKKAQKKAKKSDKLSTILSESFDTAFQDLR
ncbi:guanine nucleotide-binding protein-like 3 homolog [Varroa jacobsoni]|uniref:Guanine nucleotide-binding protein-like 3 homolog n=1 Tax=Varroa destructor TaxID=109461 RepID=A0A7M7J6D1_VARDE|nr:guanine nucleotide-binding protein-like 3 homolog [Varroa destructor]XP_022647476.1 guanine nucleotide-binding protein-like 3 homolog [Varroa destructor]XP_022704817.1 guanine nucleotide-binding protein-like 3 homolog [Varroa jacobsoni]